jgi:long-chain acyl-CoA synthetase
VYPDEIEDAYRDADLVKELCVVGLPDGKAEKVAMVVVPDWRDRDRAEIRAKLEAHVRAVSARLPFAKRVKVWHVLDAELPKTATRKVKRPLVREELARVEAAAAKGRRVREGAQARAGGERWLYDLVAEVSRRPRAEIGPDTRLASDLGFDSLMLTELAAALEEAGAPPSAAEHLGDVLTMAELARLVASAPGHADAEPERREVDEAADPEIAVPASLARLGRKVLAAGQRALYEHAYRTKVVGSAFVPHDRNVLVVANHSSHLDMGLVKVALGDEGNRLAALAARDYFFDTPLKRAYFENFTNLIPMDRDGSLKSSLRAAAEALRRGYHLLIFPEGTRSRDGTLAPFFPTAGYLALHCGVDVLPVWLEGTHAALPPGRIVPRRSELVVRFGRPIPVADLRRRTEGAARSEAYRIATAVMEEAVKALGGVAETAASAKTSTKTSTPISTKAPTSTSTRATHVPSPPAAPEPPRGPPEMNAASPRAQISGEGQGEGGRKARRKSPVKPPEET